MSMYGEPSKVKQRVKLAALILLAVISLTVAVLALTLKPDHNGMPPEIIQDLYLNRPRV